MTNMNPTTITVIEIVDCPEGSDTQEAPEVVFSTHLHDPSCVIFAGRPCNCDPDVLPGLVTDVPG